MSEDLNSANTGSPPAAGAAVVNLEDLGIAEVRLGVVVVGAAQRPGVVAFPGLEVGRGGAHHNLAVGQQQVVARVVDVIEAVTFVINGAAGAEHGVLLAVAGARGQDFAERDVVGGVGGANTPVGVVALAVVVVLLQIEHLELLRLPVEERHGVAAASDGGGVVGAESLFVRRDEGFRRAGPVLFRIGIVGVVAA